MTRFETLSTILILAGTTLSSSLVRAQNVDRTRALNRADSLYIAGEFKTAAKAYRDLAALQERPADRASLLVQAAGAELEVGDFARARLDFGDAYSVDSSANGAKADPYPLMMIGVTERLRGLPDSATVWFGRVEGMLNGIRASMSESRAIRCYVMQQRLLLSPSASRWRQTRRSRESVNTLTPQVVCFAGP